MIAVMPQSKGSNCVLASGDSERYFWEWWRYTTIWYQTVVFHLALFVNPFRHEKPAYSSMCSVGVSRFYKIFLFKTVDNVFDFIPHFTGYDIAPEMPISRNQMVFLALLFIY